MSTRDETSIVSELSNSTDGKTEVITNSPKRARRKLTEKRLSFNVSHNESSEDTNNARIRSKSKPKPVLEHKRNLVGEIIYKKHPSWVLMQNIQTGIRHSVGKSSELSYEDELESIKQNIQKHEKFFKSPKVLKFPPEGSAETQPHKTALFKFKDYCPLVFRHLREKFCIDQADYMVSLCNALDDGQNALRELPTPGKSGSLFFFSHDMRYILKTIPKREAKLLRFLLPAYYQHVMENSNTLLPKFFGLHRVKPHRGSQVRFVVMGNVFVTNKRIHERYDLKGSTVGRAVTQEEIDRLHENVTYKDIDWRMKERKLSLGSDMKTMFLEQLGKDCKFLEKMNIMDYSLLVGIHYCSTNEGKDCSYACRFKGGQKADDSQEAKYTYFDEEGVELSKDGKPFNGKGKTKDENQRIVETTKETNHEEQKMSEEQPTENGKVEMEIQQVEAIVVEITEETKESIAEKKEKKVSMQEDTVTDSVMISSPQGSDTAKQDHDHPRSENGHTTNKEEDAMSLESPRGNIKSRGRAASDVDIQTTSPKQPKERTMTKSKSVDASTHQKNSLSLNWTLRKKTVDNGKPRTVTNGFYTLRRTPNSESKPIAQTNFPLPEHYQGQISIFQRDDGGMSGIDPNVHYFVGVIDILMLYSLRKQAEHAYKSFLYSADEISSVDPENYSERFQEFISEIVE